MDVQNWSLTRLSPKPTQNTFFYEVKVLKSTKPAPSLTSCVTLQHNSIYLNLSLLIHKVGPTKVHIVKAMVFPAVMYRCESWTIIMKAEHQRIDAFKLQYWRRLLRAPWTARRSNQSILKEISPEYSLERLILKLKLQYFGYLTWRTDSLEKALMLGKIEGIRRRGWQRVR